MKLGDLVQIQSWCRSKGRMAHVVETFWWDTSRVRIQFLDKAGLSQKPSDAAVSNLIVLQAVE